MTEEQQVREQNLVRVFHGDGSRHSVHILNSNGSNVGIPRKSTAEDCLKLTKNMQRIDWICVH